MKKIALLFPTFFGYLLSPVIGQTVIPTGPTETIESSFVIYSPEWDICQQNWTKTLYVWYDYVNEQAINIDSMNVYWELGEYYDSLIVTFSKIYHIVSGKRGIVEIFYFKPSITVKVATEESLGYFSLQLPNLPKVILRDYEKTYKRAKRFKNLTPRRIAAHEDLKPLLQKYVLYEYLLYGGVGLKITHDDVCESLLFSIRPPKNHFNF
jgi:hypothetical protein